MQSQHQQLFVHDCTSFRGKLRVVIISCPGVITIVQIQGVIVYLAMCSIVVWIARVRMPSAGLLQQIGQLIKSHLTIHGACCDWLVFSSREWRISIISVLLNVIKLH